MERESVETLAGLDEDAKWLQQFEKKFQLYSGEDNLIQLDEFIQVLNIKESFFAERFFDIIDQDKSGSISLKELLTALRFLVNGELTDKLHLLFQVYDVDGNGSIDFEELRTVLRFCMAESALSLSEETLSELTEVLFEDADVDGNGLITFEELRSQLDRYPDIASNLTISAAEWLKPPKRAATKRNLRRYWGKVFHTSLSPLQYMANNLPTLFILVLFTVINIGCGVWGTMNALTNTPGRKWLVLARFCGRPLNFNCAFILVLMLRKSLTWIRGTKLSVVLPVDQHVALHKFVGVVVVVESILHVVGHIGNCADVVSNNITDATTWQFLFTTSSEIGWIGSLAFPTGWALLILLAFIWTGSFPCVRRRGYFQVFYWTHQLSLLFWLVLLLHAEFFWTVFLLPGTLYVIERILRLRIILRVRHGNTYIKEAITLPANVTYLIITRPANFDFHAGEYVFLCIPSIARHEWHPFTVSSAPEQKGFITVHVRAEGNWTKRLYNFARKFDNEENRTNKEDQIGKLGVLVEEGSLSVKDISDTPLETTLTSTTESAISHEPSIKNNNTTVVAANGKSEIFGTKLNNNNNEDVTSIRSSELHLDALENDRRLLLSRGNSTSPLLNSNGGGLSGKIRTPLPELRGTPPMPIKMDNGKQKRNSGKRSNSKKLNKVQPVGFEVKSSKPSTVSENKRTHYTADVIPTLINFVESDKQNKPLANEVSTTMTNNHQQRSERNTLKQRKTQHSLELSGLPELNKNKHTGIEIIIDGPYGTPSQHIYEAEHAVLIAGGIGVTPFASILQSIHQRYKEYKQHNPMCWSSSHIPDSDDKTFNLRKVDFIWINRHQKSFEWFISLLNLIEMEQEEIDPSQRLITIHLYMTSALSKNDVKAIGLYVALDLIHQKQRRDMITGLMTRTQAGRPDWDKVFTKIGQENCGKVTVFFCGSPQLGHVVQGKCLEHGFNFRKENF